MEEQIKKLEKRNDGFLEVTFKKAKDFDEYVLALMCKDLSCLSVIKDHKSKVKFYYDTNGYLDLMTYLKSHHFESEEILDFLIYVFENLVRVNTNKPVYLQSDLIYLSYDGGILKFLVLPLTMDKWIFQIEQSRTFLEELIKAIKGENVYMVIGYLVEQLKQKELSFPSLLQGLHSIKESARKKEPWYMKYLPRKQNEESVFIVRDIPRPVISLPPISNPDDMFMETMVLFANQKDATFVDQKTKAMYVVTKPDFQIGRDQQNDLVINDTFISSHHAVFHKDCNEIEDLNSSNGTFVNQKKIKHQQLHHGDIISFANHDFLFQLPFEEKEVCDE